MATFESVAVAILGKLAIVKANAIANQMKALGGVTRIVSFSPSRAQRAWHSTVLAQFSKKKKKWLDDILFKVDLHYARSYLLGGVQCLVVTSSFRYLFIVLMMYSSFRYLSSLVPAYPHTHYPRTRFSRILIPRSCCFWYFVRVTKSVTVIVI